MGINKKNTVIFLALCISCFAATAQAANDHGPTVVFDYTGNTDVLSPISDFMYFVPSISLVPVSSISSYDNSQMFSIVSYKKDIKSKSFKTVVEFRIRGSGYHINTYDPEAMISENLQYIKKGRPLKHMLEYIKFQGQGGCIVTTKGRINGSSELVEQIEVLFKTKKQKSPVTASLYTVKPVNGKYEYQNCYNRITARIKSLTFKRTNDQAAMQIKIDAVLNANGKEEMFSILAGSVANMITRPIRIDNDGNDTMLDFGFALHQNQSTFTFPKAKNLTDEKTRTNRQYTKNTH
ncbi:MAG: hypothetical protein KAJ07_05565 [Planctomycetes bacterium]|nr:hypothetical protein [Planctomycetota bacterium]